MFSSQGQIITTFTNMVFYRDQFLMALTQKVSENQEGLVKIQALSCEIMYAWMSENQYNLTSQPQMFLVPHISHVNYEDLGQAN